MRTVVFIVSDIIDIVRIRINVHDGIIADLGKVTAVQVHRIQTVFVIRICEKYSSVAFAEKTCIIEIAGSVSVYIAFVIFCLRLVMVNETTDRSCNDKKTYCDDWN